MLFLLTALPASGPATWAIEFIDPGSKLHVPQHSLVLDRLGTPHVLYYNDTLETLMYATKAPVWSSEIVDAPTTVMDTAIALDQGDQPHVAWYDLTRSVWYSTLVGSVWSKRLVDAYSPHPAGVSIALDSADQPHIAYYYGDPPALGFNEIRLAHWNGTGWDNETVASGTEIQTMFRLAIGPGDVRHLVYDEGVRPNSHTLKHAYWNGTAWSVEIVYVAAAIEPGGLALDALGQPRITFQDLAMGDLMYARRTGSGWITEVVDPSVGNLGMQSDLALDLADQVHVSYYDLDTWDLVYARRTGLVWVNETVDSAGVVGRWNGIAVDNLGQVHIAYWDDTNFVRRVKYARGVPDNPPPTSVLLAVSPYWRNTAPLFLEATASDPNGPVAWVDLHYRFDGGPGWGPWTSFGTDLAAPWQWSFPWPGGEGRYEFYSQAFDGAEWELQAPLADTAAGYRIPRDPPRNVTTTWDGVSGVGLSWEAPAVAPDHYLIFRALGDPRGFADLGSGAAYGVAYPPATAWSDLDALAGPEERYYLVRGADAAETDLGPTSNTAGVFAGALNDGLTAISRPLEYFPWVDYAAPGQDDTLAEYTAAFGASRIEYMDTAGTWRAGSGQRLAVGNAYLVTRDTPGTFVFTGLPGSQIRYDEGPTAGFTLAEARSLTATVAGDDVALTWIAAAAIAGIASLEVWHGTARTAIFDGSASPLVSLPTATTTFNHAGALLGGDEHYYWVVPRDLGGELAPSTYSVGVWAKAFRTHDTLALPLRLDVPRAVSWYADVLPGALGILWLTANGVWVPHFTDMMAGAYDAPVLMGFGVQISIRSAAPVRYVFVGG